MSCARQEHINPLIARYKIRHQHRLMGWRVASDRQQRGSEAMTDAVGHKKYHVTLNEEERVLLKGIHEGRSAKTRRQRAHILLLADENRADGGRTDADIASVLGVGTATVERVRKRCVMEGVEAAIERRPQANRRRRALDGVAEAKLVTLACSEPPEGFARWNLRLLADTMVELEYVEAVSHETVRRTLKKTR